jgi:hypothetical protein
MACFEVGSATIKPCQAVEAQVTVKNTGQMAGDEVVQVYLKYLVCKCSPNQSGLATS